MRLLSLYRLPTPNDQNLEKPADYRPPVPPHRTQLNAADDDDEQAPPPPKRHHHHHHHHRNRSQGMLYGYFKLWSNFLEFSKKNHENFKLGNLAETLEIALVNYHMCETTN